METHKSMPEKGNHINETAYKCRSQNLNCRLILGYHDTRDKISLYSRGTGGIDELTSNLKEEVLYGFVRIEDRFALLAYVSEQVR